MGRRTSSSDDPIERASIALFGRQRTLAVLAAVRADDRVISATELANRMPDDVGAVSKELVALERGGLGLLKRLETDRRYADFAPADTRLWEAARHLIEDIQAGRLQCPPSPTDGGDGPR